MIESVLARSFQNHKRTLIELSPHATTIIGKSRAGKSAIIRLLRWVLTNDFRGKSFIGDWGKAKAAVGVVKIDGRKITRRVGKRVNTYKLDKKVLKAPGTGVPRAVADLVNVGPTNFQGQLDSPLWFTLSPAEVSRRLNEIINLKSIDVALNTAAKNARRSKLAVSISRERVVKARAELRSLRWSREFCTQADELQRLTSRAVQIRTETLELTALGSATSEATEAVRRAQRATSDGETAVRLAKRSRHIGGQIASLEHLLETCTVIQDVVKTPLPDLDLLGKLRDRQQRSAARVRRLESLLYGIEMQEMEIDSLAEQLREAEKKLRPFKSGRCKSCGQKLPRRRNPSSERSSAGTYTSETPFHSRGEKAVRSGIKRKIGTSGS